MDNDLSESLSEFGSSAFIIKDEEGVFVDLSKPESSSQFVVFVERVFSSGYHFTDIDYGAFLELLAGPEDIRENRLRIASDIQILPPERLALYRTPKIISGNAEYLFEPVLTEKIVEEPVLGEQEDGTSEVVGFEKRTITEKASLSFDEFVAAMWVKGVRYGIDADAVKMMISGRKPGRLVFARPLPAENGQDSNLQEQSDRLYRDNAPRELPNGKIDLRQFKNRFPQVRKGEKLLKKSPRVLGAPGRDVQGQPIEPPLPQDFDLEKLAGEGTRIERTSEGEFIVAGMDGFLNLDIKTNRIAVTEKIVNYGGVSMKTTGDLLLDGEHFEEHGDIQEKRLVEGKSITVFGDVFGAVVSTGGTIHFKQNLVGGSATNQDGDIVVEGLASNALVDARYGKIRLKRAENCTIVGRHVFVEQAINCTILGEEIEIGSSEGSAMAGKAIKLGTAGPRRENLTMVSVLLPDLSAFQQRIADIGTRTVEIDSEIEALREKSKPVTAEQEVRNYLTIAGKVQRKELTLTEDQKTNLHKLGMRIAPALKTLSAVNAEIQALQKEKDALMEEALMIEENEKQASQGISCAIESLTRDTLVTKRKIDAALLFGLPPKDLKIRLREAGIPENRLSHDGSLSWQYV